MIGRVPLGLSAISTLETVLLAGNSFLCEAPTLDLATNLGRGRFVGSVFPGAILPMCLLVNDNCGLGVS